MLNIILFGAPGAGKGTQAKVLAQNYNLLHLSTGDVLRNEIANNTELGKKAKAFMDRGELVSDDIIILMVEKIIFSDKKLNGFILDGFPRTLVQAKALDVMLEKYNVAISYAIHLDVAKDILVDRLSKRAVIENRSDDADVKVVDNRISVYLEKTQPVIDFYNSQNKMIIIDGIGTPESIFSKIENIIK